MQVQGWGIKGWEGSKVFILGKDDGNVGVRVFVELRSPPADLTVSEVLRNMRAIREVRILYKDITKEEFEMIASKMTDAIKKVTRMYIVNTDFTNEGVGVISIELSIFKLETLRKLIELVMRR